MVRLIIGTIAQVFFSTEEGAIWVLSKNLKIMLQFVRTHRFIQYLIKH